MNMQIDNNKFLQDFDPALYKNKALLVTGGTGSFGKAFVNFMLDNSELSRLVIFSRDENKQHELDMSLKIIKIILV